MSTGEFIDALSLSHSLRSGETVNCCQRVEDFKAIGNSQYRNRHYIQYAARIEPRTEALTSDLVGDPEQKKTNLFQNSM